MVFSKECGLGQHKVLISTLLQWQLQACDFTKANTFLKRMVIQPPRGADGIYGSCSQERKREVCILLGTVLLEMLAFEKYSEKTWRVASL